MTTAMEAPTLTAGRAAQRAGITRKALRLYQDKGLINKPARNPAGYQLYTEHDVQALIFIRQARTLGLHLDDIATILDIRRTGTAPCPTVHTLIADRIVEIDTTIAELRALRRTLIHTRDTAPNLPATTDSAICPLIENRHQ